MVKPLSRRTTFSLLISTMLFPSPKVTFPLQMRAAHSRPLSVEFLLYLGTGIGGRDGGGGPGGATEISGSGCTNGGAGEGGIGEIGGAVCSGGGIGGGSAGAAIIFGAACDAEFDAGFLAGAAVGFGCSAEVFRVAMSRVICSWPTASWFTLCLRAARSRAIASSCCCTSGDGTAGAIGAATSEAV